MILCCGIKAHRTMVVHREFISNRKTGGNTHIDNPKHSIQSNSKDTNTGESTKCYPCKCMLVLNVNTIFFGWNMK